ncbi:MAG TPA: DNA-formamidopyrimidine glycosylase family protein [Bellilinea sp.]|nr:DNA-formamidopyrimidine glycosylase family protein [Bellilinea sp.]
MPELPELDVVCEVLNRRIAGGMIRAVEVVMPGGAIVTRTLIRQPFADGLTGQTIHSARRRGKFVLLQLDPPLTLAVNPKLTGRFQLAHPGDKWKPKTLVVLDLDDGMQLRYLDQKQMGQLYLTDDMVKVPEFSGLGPEPYDITHEEFKEQIRHYQGEIKGVLTRGQLVAGIGNAYADEILWHARIHPYRKRSKLTLEEIESLFASMQTVLRESTEKVRAEMGEAIETKPREFMAVHMKTGEPCPRCGTTISLVGANQRITNFCRTCQPGGLIKGMER